MAQAPTGTVTLVFTDIQGSTALWEHFGERFKAVLDQHNALFRAAIAELGGYEVKTEGDAFMVAFQYAESAVSMCLAMQERLQAAVWPEALNDEAVAEFAGSVEDGPFHGLRVRMGVHTGTPDCQPDPVTGRMDYFGRVVNRAARVAGVGHGGQLVVSQATWEALGTSGLEEGTLVEDLGEHALKGLERREHLRQLLPRSLSGRTFPPLRTPNLKKTNLPARLDSFFGREPELSELEQRVAGGQRLITVLGAAGTGKTRLAQRLGGTQLGDFPGGVWFCDLSDARSKVGILSAMGAALEVPLTRQDPEAQLADAILGRGRVLLILDNFEQVVEHGAETVGRWLQRAPEAVFLVTSRSLLRIAGEEVFILDPMPVPEAMSLFYDRGQAVQAGFGRTAENEPVVQEIVERLDGMSLAVELAAARVRMLSPETILSRLSERFKLLRGRRRDQSARQTTLRGTIDWSWELLKPAEQSALLQLSVFRGGCRLEAAEAVVELQSFEDAPGVMHVLKALVDHSLLRRVEPHPGHGRYRMLESIREYAAEKLGEETAATALRHATHFAASGEEDFLDSLDTHGGVERRKGLVLDLENLLAGVDGGLTAGEPELAVHCALAAAEVLHLQGPLSDGIALLQRLSGQPVCPGTRAHLFYMTGVLLSAAGRLCESLENPRMKAYAERSWHQALAVVRGEGNRRFEGKILRKLGSLHCSQGRIRVALEHHEQSLAIARELGNRRHLGQVLEALGVVHHAKGRITEAMEHHRQSLVIARQVGNRRFEGVTLGSIANLHREQGRFSEALSYFQRALAVAREVGNRRLESVTLGNLGNLHHQQGRLPEALEHHRQALAIAREVGSPTHEGCTLGNIGDLLFAQGDVTGAETHFQQAIAICDEVWPVAAGVYRGSFALLRAQQGAFDEARSLLAGGEPQVRRANKMELGKLLCKKARVEHLAGDPAAAETALGEAESIAIELDACPVTEAWVMTQELSLGGSHLEPDGRPDSELNKILAEAREAISG